MAISRVERGNQVGTDDRHQPRSEYFQPRSEYFEGVLHGELITAFKRGLRGFELVER